MTGLVAALLYLALFLLAAAQPAHAAALLPPRYRRVPAHRLRFTGWSLLTASALLAVAPADLYGLLTWIGLVALTGTALVLLRTYAAARAWQVGAAGLFAALAFTLA